jgi:hypothetical protein
MIETAPQGTSQPVVVGGLLFSIEPAFRLSAGEREALAQTGAGESLDTFPIRFELRDDALSVETTAGRPATVHATNDGVRLSHAAATGEFDIARRHAWLVRSQTDGAALRLMLRTALVSALPDAGGVALHAAGVAMSGRGVAFFGVSGAGKSTLSQTSPFPVLSDELVAVHGGRLHATGFWGSMGEGVPAVSSVPLGALVELAKGPFKLERLEPRAALRRLIGVLIVPLHPRLWSQALAVAGRLVQEVPVFRMQWSLDAPPWSRLEDALKAREAQA